jgi:hypothetical protein
MKTLAAAASLLALAACTAAEPAPAPAAAPTAAAPRQDPAAALAALFRDSDEANLRRNPLEALVRGDLRYAAEFGDYVTPAFFEAERSAVEADLARSAPSTATPSIRPTASPTTSSAGTANSRSAPCSPKFWR